MKIEPLNWQLKSKSVLETGHVLETHIAYNEFMVFIVSSTPSKKYFVRIGTRNPNSEKIEIDHIKIRTRIKSIQNGKDYCHIFWQITINKILIDQQK